MKLAPLDLAALLVGILLTSARAADKPLEEVEREAKEVLALSDDIQRRKRIGAVFECADRCAKDGRTNEASHYYFQALQHNPWNMEGQVALAQLHAAAGDTNRARQKAELVWKNAERDSQLERAARLLGRTFTNRLEQGKLPETGCALALVPYGKPDAWLLAELRDGLRDILRIPVELQHRDWSVPEPKRVPLRLKAEDLRDRIGTARKDARFEQLYRKAGLTTNSLHDDEQVFKVAETILNSDKNNEEQVRLFREELAFLRRLGPQWDSEELLRQLQASLRPPRGSNVGYLAITEMDIFVGDSRYVFGLAANGANVGLVSYARFLASLYDEPPNRTRLRERCLKQALSSIGLFYGLPRCTDPTCPRAYANGVLEHDAKKPELCGECRDGFAQRFGKLER